MDKTETISFKLTPELRAALVAICRAENRNQSEIVRDLIREKAKEYHLWPPYLHQHEAQRLVDPGAEYTTEKEAQCQPPNS